MSKQKLKQLLSGELKPSEVLPMEGLYVDDKGYVICWNGTYGRTWYDMDGRSYADREGNKQYTKSEIKKMPSIEKLQRLLGRDITVVRLPVEEKIND